MSKYCHVINLYLESLWVMRVVIRADCREIIGKRLMEQTMDGKGARACVFLCELWVNALS